MILAVIGFFLFLWLVLSFIELPMESPHEFDAVKYWQSKEKKWKGKE